ncbi:ExbD/TolR family protein [Neptunicoccus cionae]|uniref:ExbD/TolR family protein n=1 Tax=Neptunicoccus cionae TaxID=2035344 RepID=UPI000C75FA7F|nr:biopolymer transporter ExbD [Amylibacter cionae]PLS22599.1 biopolymer transporter ExbD [Amylibacter cionae]
MDFAPPPKRRTGESIVPMINVVFLLLIFFLMTSEIKPPEPFEVTLPSADRLGVPDSELTLHISKDALVRFEDFEGETAWARLGGRMEPAATVKLRIDADLPAPELAKVLRRLAPVGAGSVEIVAVPQ